MTLRTKQYIIGALGFLFLVSLIIVQALELARKREEAGLDVHPISIPDSSVGCYNCHEGNLPGITEHWAASPHAQSGIGCVDCHKAEEGDVDAFKHHGSLIATIVTPNDCGKCHPKEAKEFTQSHHAAAGNILHSLDNILAETVEGSREMFNPHGPTPGMIFSGPGLINGMASAVSGCQQCHGSKIGLMADNGDVLTMDDFLPDENGKPTNLEAVARIAKTDAAHGSRPIISASTWPNTGIGRINLDGSRGSCSACHSRHDFSPRRARKPDNCGKCHLGPDHPQREIYEESKHGIAFLDMEAHMNLDADDWVLGEDYTAAPTCATCHMSAHSREGGEVTHDPAMRISWTNRPPISLRMDTDADGNVVKETDPDLRRELVVDSADAKRQRMTDVCAHCHSPNYVAAFYKQYDDFVLLYNHKFGIPGKKIVGALRENGLITDTNFDEEIEWTWFYLWHHEGRRARHGASMMAPDYAHWHGMYEVAERFYMELIPQSRELAEHAAELGMTEKADAVNAVIDEILARPEHAWFNVAGPLDGHLPEEAPEGLFEEPEAIRDESEEVEEEPEEEPEEE